MGKHARVVLADQCGKYSNGECHIQNVMKSVEEASQFCFETELKLKYSQKKSRIQILFLNKL